jgi:hypothetical protein
MSYYGSSEEIHQHAMTCLYNCASWYEAPGGMLHFFDRYGGLIGKWAYHTTPYMRQEFMGYVQCNFVNQGGRFVRR